MTVPPAMEMLPQFICEKPVVHPPPMPAAIASALLALAVSDPVP